MQMQQPVRAWVHDGVRQTAYVRAGAGPVVILLTPASLSKAVLVWLFDELANSVRVIWPMIEDAKEMAEAMPGFLDALGIGRVSVVCIDECGVAALQFAGSDPERVGRIALLSTCSNLQRAQAAQPLRTFALADGSLTSQELRELTDFLRRCEDCQVD
jgi:pimeloyl-ACP methyl ester carboxylesterase